MPRKNSRKTYVAQKITANKNYGNIKIDNHSSEGYSVLRSMNAIEISDVVLIVFDATKQLSEQDGRIAGFVHEAKKPSVVIVNKSLHWLLFHTSSSTKAGGVN